MKLAITNEEEIYTLLRLLNEVEELHKDFQRYDFEDIDLSEYEIPGKFDRSTADAFLSDLCRKVSGIHFQRILFNCSTMLVNCADLTQDTLDFNPDIKAGLELLEQEKSRQAEYDKQKMEPYH